MDWKDKDKVREYQRIKSCEYRLKNPERFRKSRIKYCKAHPELVKERMKIYNKSPKGKARIKRWRERNPDKIKILNDKWNKINQGIRFKGKQIPLGYNPRKCACLECGKKGLTNLHHKKYDELNPLFHTIELCLSCHVKKHPHNRDEKGQFTNLITT